jgi:Zn-finger nucleic acid-binding protein
MARLIKDIKTDKECPKCKVPLSETIFHQVAVDYCPKCLGIWFEKEELRWAKDEKDKDLAWLDIDLWDKKEDFKVARGIRLCPSCRMPLYEVYYGKSGVVVDVCNLCGGIWLDRAEFRKIISWLQKEKDFQVLNNYLVNVLKETAEIFSGPETLRSEAIDLFALLKLLNYKFAVQFPVLTQLISKLPR